MSTNHSFYIIYITDSYTKAAEKVTQAEDTSNLETEDTEAEKQKSRNKRRRVESPEQLPATRKHGSKPASFTHASTSASHASVSSKERLPLPPGKSVLNFGLKFNYCSCTVL